MNRILYFVHYNKYGSLAGYVLYLLKNIRSLYSRIVFISNSPLSREDNDAVSEFCGLVLQRKNEGYDFSAWKEGMLNDGWDSLSQYDSVTLMNDTCFGPIFDLKDVYLDMEQKDSDFWGLTNHKNNKDLIWVNDKPIPEHIQSYFMCFKKNVFFSGAFRNFWEKVECKDYWHVIREYEIGLTVLLRKAGFKYSVFYDTTAYKENVSMKQVGLCLKHKVPFIKIKSFSLFSYPRYIVNFIKNNTNYPVSLIHEHLNRIYPPDVTLFTQNKMINKKTDFEKTQNLKIALHIHCFYTDVLDKYIKYLNNSNVDFDVFITTDSAEKKDVITNCFLNQPCFPKLKEIIITENLGRDVLPWFFIKDRLNNYDVAGHFHTKKAEKADIHVGESWQESILDSLLYDVCAIASEFSNNKSLGVVIPEVPEIFEKKPFIEFTPSLKNILDDLWKKLKCRKEIDFSDLKKIIFPMGTMFWYRPAALKPLFDWDFPAEDVPPEPLAEETILHGIERLILYVAWEAGYDYRIATPAEDQKMGGWIAKSRNYELSHELITLKNSLSYKTGRMLLTPFRFFKCLLRKEK
ncbi:MAG: rhamnan synthesis F family protein [Spirochaetaceae bacterium]|jgi:rhamnosyltransferase|nr:rhamnan synthesis F family protein [Spirochaetaceae bacterium]